MNTTLWTIISVLSVGAMGAVITSIVTGRRERCRDRENRKREFRGYLAELRSRIERIPHTPEKVPNLFFAYTSIIHRFHRERAKARGDFLPLSEYDRLAGRLGELRYDEITSTPNKNPRDLIAESIDALIEFTKSA